jgi:ectoine hydroxylase-related dioxygenase (phytanoyl-CoA dioxygenase family)
MQAITDPNAKKTLKQKFEDQGFVVVDDIYTEQELQEMEKLFEDYAETGGNTFDHGKAFEEQDKTKQQVRALHPHRYRQEVRDWYLKPELMDTLKMLLGKEALGAQTMYYYKPPGSKGQGMHQDNFYLLAAPATCIAAWTPIDDATEENGCLWVVPGSHKDKLYCPDSSEKTWNSYGDSHIRPFPRKYKPQPVPVMRGQTLFFGGHLIHGSGPNRSENRWRRTFIGHYVDEVTESIAKFYHPLLDRHGNTVSVEAPQGGGPCGDGAWDKLPSYH